MCDHNNGSGGQERNTEKHRQTGKSVSSDLSYHGWNLPLLKDVLLNSYIFALPALHQCHQYLPTTPAIINNRTIQSRHPLRRSFFSYQIPIALTCSDPKPQSQCDFGQLV